jgi:2-dehydro-3-deoxyphosphooctonate aldolase (KDO 8-P synthase)
LNPIQICDGVRVGAGERLLLLAGPCVVEGRDFTVRIAEMIQAIAERHGVGFVFKASFDEANRTSADSARGPGMEDGLATLAAVRESVGVPVVTDIHESWQAEPTAAVVDVLQIPAFLSRQTDLLAAAAATGRVVNVKKGQFLSAADMGNVVRKLQSAGARRILVTERGTTFGYNDLVVDFRGLPQLRAFGYPVVFDATHSVQQPGGLGGSTGGQREYVPHLARAAAAVAIDGLFVEVHDDPDSAPSDGPNMITPDMLDRVLGEVTAVRAALS